MKFILIGVAAITAVALLEAMVHTLRFVSDRKKDELKRRLSALGSGQGGPAVLGVLRMGKLANNPAIDAMLRSMKFAARLETLLEQTELEMTVAQLVGTMIGTGLLGLLLSVFASSGLRSTDFTTTMVLLAFSTSS